MAFGATTLVLCSCLAVGLCSTWPWSRKLGGESSPLTETYVSSYEIIQDFPHDGTAFTQGLVFDAAGQLYESDGLFGKSAVRKVDVKTGTSQVRTLNTRTHFGEGIEIVGNKLVQLTWKNNMINEFSLSDLTLQRSLPFNVGNREGWGLASDGKHLYLTDSTDALFTLNMTTYAQIKKMKIIDPKLGENFAIHGVNELEMVEDELWGNIYPMYQGSHSECIVRINPSTGAVIGWIDMRGLLHKQRAMVQQSPHNYVLNGVAYHKTSGRLYVTGKQWDHMYQVRIKPAPELGAAHVAQHCGLGDLTGALKKKAGRRLRVG